MKIYYPILLLVFCGTSFEVPAQTVQDKVKQFVQQNKNSMIDEYTGFVAIPDVSGDSENIPLNAAFIQKMMENGASGYILKNSSKEELISKIMFLVNAPAQRIATALAAVNRNLAVTVNEAVKANKFGPGSAPAPVETAQ
jgi:hypothetical protein